MRLGQTEIMVKSDMQNLLDCGHVAKRKFVCLMQREAKEARMGVWSKERFIATSMKGECALLLRNHELQELCAHHCCTLMASPLFLHSLPSVISICLNLLKPSLYKQETGGTEGHLYLGGLHLVLFGFSK